MCIRDSDAGAAVWPLQQRRGAAAFGGLCALQYNLSAERTDAPAVLGMCRKTNGVTAPLAFRAAAVVVESAAAPRSQAARRRIVILLCAAPAGRLGGEVDRGEELAAFPNL